MRYRIHQIKINVGTISDMDDISGKYRIIEKEIRQGFKRTKPVIRNITIVRESIDARRKPDIRLVYTVDFDCGCRICRWTRLRSKFTISRYRSESREKDQ